MSATALKRSREQILAIQNRGSRVHRCEGCGVLFECEECTEAMHHGQRRANLRRTTRRNHNGMVLYGPNHSPNRGGQSGEALSIRYWHCEECK